MKTKFVFKPVEKTFSDPSAATFKPGVPFGREYSKGDMVLLHPEITSSVIYLNSNILRDAILDSKEYVEEALGLRIEDAKEDAVSEEVVQAVATAIVEEAKEKEETVEEVVNEIVEEATEEETSEESTEEAPAEDTRRARRSRRAE